MILGDLTKRLSTGIVHRASFLPVFCPAGRAYRLYDLANRSQICDNHVGGVVLLAKPIFVFQDLLAILYSLKSRCEPLVIHEVEAVADLSVKGFFLDTTV